MGSSTRTCGGCRGGSVDRRRRIVCWLQIATALGIALYWAGFFLLGAVPENPPEAYLAFERAFPLPDAVLALCLLAGG